MLAKQGLHSIRLAYVCHSNIRFNISPNRFTIGTGPVDKASEEDDNSGIIGRSREGWITVSWLQFLWTKGLCRLYELIWVDLALALSSILGWKDIHLSGKDCLGPSIPQNSYWTITWWVSPPTGSRNSVTHKESLLYPVVHGFLSGITVCDRQCRRKLLILGYGVAIYSRLLLIEGCDNSNEERRRMSKTDKKFWNRYASLWNGFQLFCCGL